VAAPAKEGFGMGRFFSPSVINNAPGFAPGAFRFYDNKKTPCNQLYFSAVSGFIVIER